jgi:hypothetical protein
VYRNANILKRDCINPPSSGGVCITRDSQQRLAASATRSDVYGSVGRFLMDQLRIEYEVKGARLVVSTPLLPLSIYKTNSRYMYAVSIHLIGRFQKVRTPSTGGEQWGEQRMVVCLVYVQYPRYPYCILLSSLVE